MYLGRVIGTVVSTSKNESLIGMKLLVVEKLTERLEREGSSVVRSSNRRMNDTVTREITSVISRMATAPRAVLNQSACTNWSKMLKRCSMAPL